jgi:hypothetical protein
MKMSFFLKQMTGKQNWSCLEVGTSGRGEDIRKRYMRVNLVEICIYVRKWKK